MPTDQIVVALDIGTTKICTLVAEVEADREVNIVGVGIAPSAGMSKGTVVDIDKAAQAIRQSVEKCERLSGYAIESAFVGVTGSHISSVNRKGVVAVSPNAAEITSQDVERAMDAARVQAISGEREILHVLPRGYTLDGQNGVRDPVGMAGRRLEAEVHIISAGTTFIHNMVRCVNRAGLDIDDLVLQPLASGEAVLNPTDKDIGVAIADIGGGTTDIAVFGEGTVVYTGAIDIAGNHITQDLAKGLGCAFFTAEQVKIQHGSALVSQVDRNEALEVRTFDNEEGELIARTLVAEIVEARAAQILEKVQEEIRRGGFQDHLPAGVVLVGGTAELRDIRKLARELLGLPVRVGVPGGAVGLTDTIMRPAYATSIGLLEWAAYHTEDVHTSNGHFPSLRGMNRLRSWLREFLS